MIALHRLCYFKGNIIPVPATINDIFTTAGSNPPGGGETPGEGDNHLRAAYSFIAALRDMLNGTTDPVINGFKQVASAAKSSTTSRASTTTLADDPHLVVALTAGTWSIDGLLNMVNGSAGGNGGLKISCAFTGTATGSFTAAGSAAGATSTGQRRALGASSTLASTAFNTGSLDWYRMSGHAVVTVAGNLKLQWAQENSNAIATAIETGSWLKCTKVT